MVFNNVARRLFYLSWRPVRMWIFILIWLSDLLSQPNLRPEAVAVFIYIYTSNPFHFTPFCCLHNIFTSVMLWESTAPNLTKADTLKRTLILISHWFLMFKQVLNYFYVTLCWISFPWCHISGAFFWALTCPHADDCGWFEWIQKITPIKNREFSQCSRSARCSVRLLYSNTIMLKHLRLCDIHLHRSHTHTQLKKYAHITLAIINLPHELSRFNKLENNRH